MSKGYKVLVGIAAAALAGVGLGVLLAPSSGKKTRNKLRKASDKVAKKMKKAAKDSGDSVEEFAKETVSKAKSNYNQAKGYVKAESNNLAEKMDKNS